MVWWGVWPDALLPGRGGCRALPPGPQGRLPPTPPQVRYLVNSGPLLRFIVTLLFVSCFIVLSSIYFRHEIDRCNLNKLSQITVIGYPKHFQAFRSSHLYQFRPVSSILPHSGSLSESFQAFRIRICVNTDPDPAFYLIADPYPSPD